MGNGFLYKKMFFIFSQEDSGFGIGQSPSGYVRIEVRDGIGKLSAAVQNLKEDPRSIIYKLYIMKCTDRDFIPVYTGVLPLAKNKGELQWEFSAGNIANTKSTIEDINTVVIIAENISRENEKIICPLAAYKDKKTEWREKLRDTLYLKINNCIKEELVDNNMGYKISKKEEAENLYNVTEDMQGQAFEKTDTENEKIESRINWDVISHSDSDSTKDNMPGKTDNLNIQNNDNNINYQQYKEMVEKQGHHYTMKNNEMNAPCGNTGCSYITGDPGVNPCLNCIMRKASAESADMNVQGDADRLKRNLDRCFEICDPFRSRRRDYKWWKINSPVHLNNVLYQCNIKTPVLFNPKILMSHFKYRHLIFGIYTDTVRHKEYVVFGVPGVYNVDDRPFKDICRWAQVEGNKPRYGAFGYWLVYIDPKTGKIV